MSKLNDTKLAYDRVSFLLSQQMLSKRSETQKIQEAQKTVNLAFYLLGWSQFEYLLGQEAKDKIGEIARQKDIDGEAWKIAKTYLSSLTIRQKLELLFFGKPKLLHKLHKDYKTRNEIAHEYKRLPSEVSDISSWLEHLEDLVDNF